MQKPLALIMLLLATGTVAADDRALEQQFSELQPVLREFCFGCHSAETKEGELDLERFKSVKLVREDVKPWQAMIQQLETREMPPKAELQPTEAQRMQLIDWARGLIDNEARARAGDPGRVPLHRLSNTEYNHTIRDLTGIDLQPARDFPADGAAGEGFTNAADALAMSPAMMAKYVNAAKDIGNHAVLLPDGFRFSNSATQRDWTDESLAALRNFYRQFTHEGSLPLKPYLEALVRHRSELAANQVTLDQIATDSKLSPKYLAVLWRALNDDEASYPLDRVRSLWHSAAESNVEQIVGEVSEWFDRLWEFPRIGSYVSTHRQAVKNPVISQSQSIRIKLEPAPGQNEVVLYLVARELNARRADSPPGFVTWNHPRFEGANLPTLSLRDYDQFGPRYELDYATIFANTESYLAAAVEAANNPNLSLQQLAAKHRIDEAWLKRWITVLNVKPINKTAAAPQPGRPVPAVAWQLLDEPTPNAERPAIDGWRAKGADLPILISNSSDKTEHVPGRMSPHWVAVHPSPTEFVAAVWKSPINGQVRVSGRVADAHAACGNGVGWWLEKQSLEKQSTARSAIVAEGTVDLGKETDLPAQQLSVVPGDSIFLAIDARSANHGCDLTEIALTITEVVGEAKPRVWDLAHDVADHIADGNPHTDSLGNRDVWSFVKGLSKDRPAASAADTDRNTLLARWRTAAASPDGQASAAEIAQQLQALLTGQRPAADGQPDRKLHDHLISSSGPLLQGFDVASLGKASQENKFGLPQELFGVHPQGKSVDKNSLLLPTDKVTSLRLPSAIFRDREFVVDCTLDADSDQAAVQCQILLTPPNTAVVWDASAPIVAVNDGPGKQKFLEGLAEFRRIFPPNICYPHIIPLDEVVCLKTFHREDEPLIRLFLSDEQTEQLERLWQEHRFITKYPIVENEYLPLFIGFVTQDQPKALIQFFEDKRPTFQQWADEFAWDFEQAAPRQIEQLLAFAARAYRRPLSESERSGLASLYQTLREKDISHEEAFRSLLARVLMSPSFLLHLEQAPPGSAARPVDDWELASRLSYFLWASMPDEALRELAAAGELHQPEVLAEQIARMLKDDRARALAIEFGTQWIHVRGFDQFNEKNEQLFPTFDAALRQAMYEEAILFFHDLFQNGGRVTQILDADHTFLNDKLAQHYGIGGVSGQHWRRVEGVKKFGRGGILGFASVQAKQAGASRTSPVLRGNWVVETVLGEKLPRPPPNVPQLPESEIGNGGLTMRQIVEKHVSDAQCASCHQRMDPFGLALERYDPIGRLRDKDLGGLPVDASATLRDGTAFEGIEGLRGYLLQQKKETFVRLFYQRLLGYALGRSVSLSDQVLLDQMMDATQHGEGDVTNAVIAIVQSPQFRMIRGTSSIGGSPVTSTDGN